MSAFEPIFRALEESGARYVVVGGLATVLHGYLRVTALAAYPRQEASMSEGDWGTWESDRRRKHTRGMEVPVEARLAWIEEMLLLALERGAIPKRRDEWGRPLEVGEPAPTERC